MEKARQLPLSLLGLLDDSEMTATSIPTRDWMLLCRPVAAAPLQKTSQIKSIEPALIAFQQAKTRKSVDRRDHDFRKMLGEYNSKFRPISSRMIKKNDG